jgi:hypothetical protein
MKSLTALVVALTAVFCASTASAEPRPIHEDIQPFALDTVATDVMAGNYGNGADRIDRLTKLGLTGAQIDAVQDIVDTMVPAVVVVRSTGRKPTTQATGSGAWQGSRPAYYGGSTGCSQYMADVIANAMWARGADNNAVTNMLAVISRESACSTTAFNGSDATKDTSYGLCQINARAGFFRPGQILAAYSPSAFAGNPEHNAAACAALWARCGFHPWQKGNYGCHRP